MLKLFPRLFAILILTLSSLTISAQLVNVNTVAFPGLPATSCTNTFVDVSLQLNCINMVYVGPSTSISGSTITVSLDYTLGPICLGALSFPTENINMGMIPAGTYTVVVNGILNGAIVSTQTTSLTVNSCCSANPGFTTTMDTVCPGDSVFFSNTSTGATSQAWYVNNNQVSTNVNHGQIFPNTGTYNIKLVVSATSCSDSTEQQLYVINSSTCCAANPGFVASTASGCAGDSIYFTNTSSGANQYNWYVGNNLVSSGTDYGQVFNAAGNYTVSLVAGDGSCSDSISQTIQITDPFVNLGPDTMICREATVLLVAGFQYDSIFWSDGSRGATLNTGPGTYWVQVYKNGCSASDTAVVGEVPVVPADLGGDTTLCVGDTLTLDVMRPGATYMWSNNSTNASISVTDSGSYWVVITEPNGCTTSDTLSVSLDSCNAGLEGFNVKRMDIYPQPAVDFVHISVALGWDEFSSLELLDISGRVISRYDLKDWYGTMKLEVSQLPDGVYILNLKGANQALRRQVVIRR
jgi:PKD repeat protein